MTKSANIFISRWDDWVPQERLRKLTDDNKELAANLRRELTQQSAPKSAQKPLPPSKTRRGQGSDLGSGRGSEERHSSVPAGGRGTKRGRDNDIEKVCGPYFSLTARYLFRHDCNQSSFLTFFLILDVDHIFHRGKATFLNFADNFDFQGTALIYQRNRLLEDKDKDFTGHMRRLRRGSIVICTTDRLTSQVNNS